MHPIIFTWGSFRLPMYGVVMATALVAAVYTVVRLGRREGLDSARLIDFSTWTIVVGLLGAKVLLILTDLGFYMKYPGQIFSWGTLQAGGVFYGGFIAAVLFAVWYSRVERLPTLKIFDLFSPAVALGLSIGRLGCFAAGCDYGKPTNSIFKVTYSDPRAYELSGVPLGVPLHPTQIYESLASLAIFFVLLWRFRRKAYDGQVFWTYLGLYAVARFFIEFLRGDAVRGFVVDQVLSTSQFIALLALGSSTALAFYLRTRRGEATAPAVGEMRGAGN